jgi:hypothetical protein
MTAETERPIDLHRRFVAAADERPAEGQLDAVLARTRAIPQRRRWAARLPRMHRSMRVLGDGSTLVGLAAAVVLLLLLILAMSLTTGGGPPRSPFTGSWMSIDIQDGSTQRLEVGTGDRPPVVYEDLVAAVCSRHGDTSTHWLATGAAAADGDHLVVAFTSGGCSSYQPGPYPAWYDYDPATDTLHDYLGNTYRRAS